MELFITSALIGAFSKHKVKDDSHSMLVSKLYQTTNYQLIV